MIRLFFDIGFIIIKPKKEDWTFWETIGSYINKKNEFKKDRPKEGERTLEPAVKKDIRFGEVFYRSFSMLGMSSYTEHDLGEDRGKW